jgi:glycosyltransferase involved in cell wall biosynthesis
MVDRILYFVLPGDIETRTGGYEYDRRIIAGLRARGWTVHVVSLDGDYPFINEDARKRAAHALAAIPGGSRVIVDGLAFGVLPAEMMSERLRLRLVGLVHHPLGLETGIAPAESERLLASECEALKSARGVVVTSPRTTRAVTDLGVPRDRIAAVEPGTEPAAIAPGSGSPILQMLTVASVVPRKGHDTLFAALSRLTNLDWRLNCVGSLQRDAAYASRLVARSVVPPLAGRVSLSGELAGAPLERAYQEADLFVLPTHYEGYGMAVAEALARAVPVVSTCTGAIADLIGGDAGILVAADDPASLGDALQSLLDDRSRLGRLRDGALRVRNSLPTWEGAAERMEEALQRFTGS